MQSRAVTTTLARFALRFAALMALTLAVLASVSVSASREQGEQNAAATIDYSIPDTAEDVNSRRYPLRDHALPR